MAGAASATITLTLGTGNAGLSGFLPPYGSVDVTRTDATHASIVFNSNTAGGYYFLGAQAAGVNVNATTWTVGSLTENGAGTIADGGSNNIDGHGSFNLTFDQTDGFTDRSSVISFTLTNTGATTWATDASVLTGNNLGNTIGAHIGACNTGCTAFATTGFATNGGGGVIPEPATWAMMILGFGGVGAMLRRRRVPQLAIV